MRLRVFLLAVLVGLSSVATFASHGFNVQQPKSGKQVRPQKQEKPDKSQLSGETSPETRHLSRNNKDTH